VKSPILVGIALAVVILAASVVVPRLRSSAREKAEQAQDRAALAERELARYSLALPLADALAQPDVMKSQAAQLDAAVEHAAEPLKQTSAEYAKLARAAQEAAKSAGLPVPTLRPLGSDTASVQRAIADFQASVKENQALLNRALQDATAAVGIDGQAIGVQQAAGMAEYVRAAEAQTASSQLRSQQADAQARLLDVGMQWKAAQGWLDYYRGLETAPVVKGLQDDLEELGVRQTEATTQVSQLTAQVAERKQALDQVEQKLAQEQAAWQELQKKGFTVGQDQGDEGFDAYRARYLSMADRVRQLQQQAQELRYGSLQGVQVSDENWATGKLQNGEPAVGLEELQRRLDIAQDRAKLFTQAVATLKDEIQYVTDSGEQAQTEAAGYQKRMDELAGTARDAVAEIEKLAGSAFDKEAEALKAVDSSVRAFAQSQKAVEAWVRALREVQREKDLSHKNERLDRILKDPYLENLARSAEASARVLAGRIYLARVENGESLLGDMRVFAETYSGPQIPFEASTYETQVDTARAAGLETVQTAAQLYTTVSDKLSAVPTVWVPLGSAAAVYDLLAEIDPTQAGEYRGKATELIQKAVEKREQSPYLQPFVAFRDHLAGMAAPEAPAKTTEPASPEQEAESATQ
jgi:chromosome segregation ATPase